MDSIGIQYEGREGTGGKRGRVREPNLRPAVDSIQVCAKAENPSRSIWKSTAEAERLGCTPALLLKGALITVIAPCVN